MTHTHLKICVVLMVLLAVASVVYGTELGRASAFVVWSVVILALVVFVGAGRVER